MEPKSPKHQGQESLSYQRRVWKNLQERTKPLLSPKPGMERRGTTGGGAEGSKKESGLWMFKRKKKHLDRVISSSQPNLCCSSPAPFGGGEPRESPGAPGTGAEPLLPPAGAACGAPGGRAGLGAPGSPGVPGVCQLIVHQQKSSSLGSACFEKLVMDSEEEQLRKNASDSVSKVHVGARASFMGGLGGYGGVWGGQDALGVWRRQVQAQRRARCACQQFVAVFF